MIDKIGSGKVHSKAPSEARAASKEEKKEESKVVAKDKVSISRAARKGKGVGKAGEPSAKKKKKWTVLFYFDGNNNLASMAVHQFNSLLKVGSDENVNLVGQISVPEESAERGLITGEKSEKGDVTGGRCVQTAVPSRGVMTR